MAQDGDFEGILTSEMGVSQLYHAIYIYVCIYIYNLFIYLLIYLFIYLIN